MLLPRPNFHVSLEQIACNDEMLDFVSALVDTRHAQVAVPAFNRHFAGVAHASVNLHYTVYDAIVHVRPVELCHTGLVAVIQSPSDFPGGLQSQPFSAL